MFLTKIKAILLVLVTVGAASGGAAWAIRTPAAGNPPAPAESRTVTPPRSDQQTIERSSGPLPGLRPEEATPGRVPSAVPSGGMGLPPRPGAQNPQARGAPRGRTPFIRSDSIIIAESPDRLSLQAISLDENKDWQRLTLPPGVTAIPMLSDDTVAPAFEGQSIRQVAAFSKSIGEWRTQQLMKPAEGQLSPIIGSGGAVYQVGNDVYAFSAFMGSWGVLHLEGADRPQITLSSKDIMVTHGNRLYVFGLRQGRFSSGIEVNREPARREPRATKPVR